MSKIISIVLLTLVLYSISFAQPPHELRSSGQTVIDTGTGLQWVKDPSQFGKMTWDSACDFVENLEFGGYSDWRLPSGLNPDGSLCNSQPSGANCRETELGHLYFFHYLESPPGEMPPFENIGWTMYWTSTEFPVDTTKVMTQDFIDGGNNPLSKSIELSVWPVRKSPFGWIYHRWLGWLFVCLVFGLTAIAIPIMVKRRRNVKLPPQ